MVNVLPCCILSITLQFESTVKSLRNVIDFSQMVFIDTRRSLFCRRRGAKGTATRQGSLVCPNEVVQRLDSLR